MAQFSWCGPISHFWDNPALLLPRTLPIHYRQQLVDRPSGKNVAGTKNAPFRRLPISVGDGDRNGKNYSYRRDPYVLHFTGCRISEALALTCDRVDFTNGVITFESLKKRRGGVYRSVPVPPPCSTR